MSDKLNEFEIHFSGLKPHFANITKNSNKCNGERFDEVSSHSMLNRKAYHETEGIA